MTAKYAVVKNGSNLQEIQTGDRLNGESTGVYFDTIALSSADIATLSGGIDVVPAQGSGTIVTPVYATIQYTPGSVSFTNDAFVSIEINGSTSSSFDTNDIMAFNTASVGDIGYQEFQRLAPTYQLVANIENQPIKLYADVDPTDPGGANGTVSVYIEYKVIPVV